MYTVGSAEDAWQTVDSGLDIIVSQGWESGGHVRRMAAAFMLGADGIWIGTRFP